MKIELDDTLKVWAKYAKFYDPIKCASIDGTDSEPHDRAVVRALSSTYKPNRFVKGRPECTLFVSRLNHETSKDTIKDIFSKYGKLKRFRMVKDIVTGMPKGYAFVEYEEEQAAEEAYRLANKMVVDGNIIFVDFECERLLKGWKPRRLGGGFAGKKESGQLRFGCRDRPFKKPITLELKEQEDRKQREKERRKREEDRHHRDKSRDRHKRKSPPRENGNTSPLKKISKHDLQSRDRTKRPLSPKEREGNGSPPRKTVRYHSLSKGKSTNDRKPPRSPHREKNTIKDVGGAAINKTNSSLRDKNRSNSLSQKKDSKTSPSRDNPKHRSSKQEVNKTQSRENTKQMSPNREKCNTKSSGRESSNSKSSTKESSKQKSHSKSNIKQKSPIRENKKQTSGKAERPRSPPKEERVRHSPSKQNGGTRSSSERHIKRSPPRERTGRRSPIQRKVKLSPEKDFENKRSMLVRNEIRSYTTREKRRSRSPTHGSGNYNFVSRDNDTRTYNKRESSPRRQLDYPPERDIGRRHSPLPTPENDRGRDRIQIVSPRHNMRRSPISKPGSPLYSNAIKERSRHRFSSPSRRSPPRGINRHYSPSRLEVSRQPPLSQDIRDQPDKRSPVYHQAREYRGGFPINERGRHSSPGEYFPRNEYGINSPKYENHYPNRDNQERVSYADIQYSSHSYSGSASRATDFPSIHDNFQPYSPRIDFHKPHEGIREFPTFQGNITNFPSPREFPSHRDYSRDVPPSSFYPSKDVLPVRDFRPSGQVNREFHSREDRGYLSPTHQNDRHDLRERNNQYESRQFEEFPINQNLTQHFSSTREGRKLPPSRSDGNRFLSPGSKSHGNRGGLKRY